MTRPAAALLAPLLAAALACGGPPAPPAAAVDAFAYAPATGAVDAWAAVLARAAWRGGLDYQRLAADRSELDRYLASLAAARPEAATREERIAFWINAYNAVVADRVLRHPGIDSVQQVEGFFDRLTSPVAGEELTLDQIERRALDLEEPRVHFAVVCASTGCPDLRGEPYAGERLEEQLGEQTRAFLGDESKGLRFDAAANELWLSSLFLWYADDFAAGSPLGWIAPRLPAELGSRLLAVRPTIRYLGYDWSLNDRRRADTADPG